MGGKSQERELPGFFCAYKARKAKKISEWR